MAPKKKQEKKNDRRGGKMGKMQEEALEIEALNARIEAGKPRSGWTPLATAENVEEDPVTKCKPYAGAKWFEQLPISEKTLKGLKDANYVEMTKIQRAAIPHALCGREIIGAAKTGSGKTLAYLVPVVEHLYRMRWGSMDGLGALIISPTRELAEQIYDVLGKITKYHTFQNGLLIGGWHSESEVNKCNILVCTPGRLEEHMGKGDFEFSYLQVLVLDEADRMLDQGFKQTLNSILSELPKDRITYLFSATQTRDQEALARLGFSSSPEYVFPQEDSKLATPKLLKQAVVIVPADQKLDTLWSFIKTHLRSKILVFLSSCKQVKFVHEVFRHLRPGIPLSCLNGRQSQEKRNAVFNSFGRSRHAVLFATDIAARGLDFPAVDWVLQVDCPENVDTYIHRVGRTARHTSEGCSLLFLCPSEEKMLELLKMRKCEVKRQKPKLLPSISQGVAALLSKDADLKYLAQRAFVTYLRSIHIHGNKEIFDVKQIPVAELAASYGLPSVPRVRFLKAGQSNQKKNIPYALKKLLAEEGKPAGDEDAKLDSNMADPDDDDNTFFKKRPRDELSEDLQEIKVAKPKKKKLKIDPAGQRLLFAEDENANAVKGVSKDDAVLAEARFKKLEQEMRQRDKKDRLLEKKKLREKRQKEKEKFKGTRPSSEDEENGDEETSQQEEDNDDMEEQEQGFKVDRLSLAQQEALAAKLLKSRR